MKICRVSYAYPNEKTPGGGLFAYNLCKYINEPTLFLTKEIKTKKIKSPKHVLLKEISFKDEATPLKLRNELHTGQKKNPLEKIMTHLKVAKMMRGFIFLLKSIPTLVSFKPDIVACHENRSILHGIFAKYFLGSKFVLHIHNNSEIEVIRNLSLLRFITKRADLIFCLSHKMVKELLNILPGMAEKIRSTSTGINPSLFKNIGMSRKNQIIAIGSFKWTKGYKYLLNAMPNVFLHYPEFNLIIVGEGQEKRNMKNQIKSLRISNKVQLPGIVSRKQVAGLLNESKIFVMSSLKEGLPKVLLEALACGTPAVITTGCNADTIIQGKGLLVETKNSQALAAAIKKLIEDKELWEMCFKNCKDIRNKYNWENVVKRVYINYKETMNLSND